MADPVAAPDDWTGVVRDMLKWDSVTQIPEGGLAMANVAGAAEAKRRFSELMGRVVSNGERFII